MSHVTHTLHDPAIHLPSFLPSIILIISGGRYNLWSYTLCSFLQYPTTFNHNSLWTDQHCSQTQSTDFPQCHTQSVTPTAIKVLSKHTNVYTSIASFQKAERRAKHYEAAVCISPNWFPLNFFILQSSFLIAIPKYFKFLTLLKFHTMYQLRHFLWCKIPTVNLEYIIREEM